MSSEKTCISSSTANTGLAGVPWHCLAVQQDRAKDVLKGWHSQDDQDSRLCLLCRSVVVSCFSVVMRFIKQKIVPVLPMLSLFLAGFFSQLGLSAFEARNILMAAFWGVACAFIAIISHLLSPQASARLISGQKLIAAWCFFDGVVSFHILSAF